MYDVYMHLIYWFWTVHMGVKNKRQQRGIEVPAGDKHNQWRARIMMIARTGFRVHMAMRSWSEIHVTPSRSATKIYSE